MSLCVVIIKLIVADTLCVISKFKGDYFTNGAQLVNIFYLVKPDTLCMQYKWYVIILMMSACRHIYLHAYKCMWSGVGLLV